MMGCETNLHGRPEARIEEPCDGCSPASARKIGGNSRVVDLASITVFLSALPDAMVAPLLRQLLVERYDISESAAHAFMIVNILGGLLAVSWLRLHCAQRHPKQTIAAAAAINGALLMLMGLPIGFGATLALRIAEGAVDLVVFAVLFNLLRSSASSTRCASRLGVGATSLMFGLAAGMAMSGPLSAIGEGAAFTVGGVACLLAAALALRLPFSLSAIVEPACHRPSLACMRAENGEPLWPAMVMAGSDRALGAMLAVSVPMHVANSGTIPAALVGPAVGTAMILMALGAWTGGALADRLGAIRARSAGAMIYGMAFLSLPMTVTSPGAFIGSMVALGLSGAVLLPTTLALAAGSGRGAAAMGACQAAGHIGFALGIGFTAGMLHLAGPNAPSTFVYNMTIGAAAITYLMLNSVAGSAASFASLAFRRETTAPSRNDEYPVTTAVRDAAAI